MRALILAVAAVSLSAGVASAQSQPATQPTAPIVVADPVAPTHEECKAVMGRKMDPVVTHDHGAMKGAPTAAAHRKPLSAAQMEKMHQSCAAKMAQRPDAKK